jgi:hypothetical protein
MEAFAQCFEGLEDPRTGNAGLHNLHELLMIALCTVLCGGQTAVDMHLFARAKEDFLRGFLKLENGLPSHDTSVGYSGGSIPTSSRPAFSGSWPASLRTARA